MKQAIDFYFDFSSPYGYFASTRIEALAARYGRKVSWRPVLLGMIFKVTGGRPLPSIPVRGEYAVRDMVRTARFHDIAYRHPDPFPVPAQAASRAMLWISEVHGESPAIQFARAVFHAYFVEGINIGEPDNVIRIGMKSGLDGAALAAGIGTDAIKEKLKADTGRAMECGVFGSPYIIVDGEPFWGFDRFDQLEAFLQDGRI